jgi:uroporphyrinogen decarboxylase
VAQSSNMAMTSVERVRAALAGEAVDRPPVALWRHFPERDQRAADLAAETLAWQRGFDFDLIKFMPPGDYATIDWGAESRYAGSPGGTRETTRFPVTTVEDWAALPPLDVQRGFNGEMLEAVQQTRRALDPAVPLLQTIFSPLTIAAKLSNGAVKTHVRERPDLVHAGLRRIAGVTRDMLAASLAAGADGIFFASQLADRAVLDDAAYAEFGIPYDLAALDAIDPDAILLLHLHGQQPMLEIADRYPPGFLNWHDRKAGSPLEAGAARTGRPVAGGIDESRIATQTPAEVAAQARSAIASMPRALLVSPGCVVPAATPADRIAAAVAAVRGQDGAGR